MFGEGEVKTAVFLICKLISRYVVVLSLGKGWKTAVVWSMHGKACSLTHGMKET